MAYRNLTFRSLAADIRTETYLGEEHIVVPCIALVGDEVVYGMNAEGPEFIPAAELEFSTLGWSGRPVLYDHPSNSTYTANEPAVLESMCFGQIFHPTFSDNKLRVEAYCNKRRALEIGQEGLINSIENGEVVELSVGAIISLERKPGIAPNGKQYTAIWHDVQSDHLAIGLSGSQGACNIEMGCGANRMLKANGQDTNDGNVRTMRAMRGVDIMPEIRTATKPNSKPNSPTLPVLDIKPRSLKQRILSLASQAFRSLADDEGLSDKDLRDKLWDQLYAVEPAFYGIENVYQESSTVTYITSPDKKLHMWRRSFVVGDGDDGAVTINDDREEVAVTEFYYIYMGENPTATVAAQASDKPCGCHTVSVNETRTATDDNDHFTDPKEDTEMPDDPKKTDPNQPATTPTTPAKPATAATPATTPVEDPKPADNQNAITTSTSTAAAVTPEMLNAALEAHPLVKHYRAQEAKEKASLIAALGKKQKVFTVEQLTAMSLDQIRPIAELAGVGTEVQPATTMGDYSGRMMAASIDDDAPEVVVPKPWSAALKAQKGEKTDNKAN